MVLWAGQYRERWLPSHRVIYIGAMSPTSTLTTTCLNVDRATWPVFRKLAKKRGLSASEVIREMVAQFVAEHEGATNAGQPRG